MHLHLLMRCPIVVYQSWVLTWSICQRLGEIINFLSMFDFEEELVCLYSIVKVYVANHVLCQSDHPFYHGQIVSSKVGVTITTGLATYQILFLSPEQPTCMLVAMVIAAKKF